MSQQDLKEATGLSQTQLSHLELGKCSPRPETMRRIEKTLGMRVNWLQTRGLRAWREGQMSTWELVEQNFRKALFGIKSLQKGEQLEFIKLAKQYLREVERELKVVKR
jgi:transcriptional regulator with XRE-family HTH domain